MDEDAFRHMLDEVIERPCVFEKAILTCCVKCGRAERMQIAEREAVTCQDGQSLSRCTELHDGLRRSFAFALGEMRSDIALPHAQEMRVQCGGLKGLQDVLTGSAEVEDVDALLQDSMRQFGTLADFPYSQVVHAAAQNYKGRLG